MKLKIRMALGAITTCALAGSAVAQTLYACDSSRALSTIDMTTGAKTIVGTISVNASTTAGLCFNPDKNVVYLTSTGNDSLYTLDLVSGTATFVGSYGDSAIVMHGLEYDCRNEVLYGVSSHNNGLYIIDQNTGAATLVGTSGLTSFSNLCYDLKNDVMFSTNSGVDSFYRMNRSNGAVALIGPLSGPTNPNGLAYDYRQDRVFLVCNNTDSLYTIDRTNGTATLVGSHAGGNLLGLVYVTNPTSHAADALTILSGTPFGGTVAETAVSDDAYFYLLNDENDPNGVVELGFSGVASDTPLKISVESAATRTDLSQFIDAFNHITGGYNNLRTSVPTLADSTEKIAVEPNSPYVTPGSGSMRLRIRWIPQADLEASDGWSESLDLVRVLAL